MEQAGTDGCWEAPAEALTDTGAALRGIHSSSSSTACALATRRLRRYWSGPFLAMMSSRVGGVVFFVSVEAQIRSCAVDFHWNL